jgi:CheY-like chemotaxis protein
LIAKIREDSRSAATPIVVYCARAFEPAERAQLESARDVTLVMGDDSNNRILDETRQFVHRVIAVPAAPPPAPAPAARSETSLAGKTVLLADDDMRNVYSLANALGAKRLNVVTAADGQEALDELAAHPEIDIVLMDIAMPRLDGHEAMRRIRAQPAHAKLPMIALTAKTMPGDREKCIEAGANDYMPKPIDIDRLLALMRVWLS